MVFLHVAMLTGATLVAVPVILHLVMRQQPRRLEFPALRFIVQRATSNRRKLRLRHLLLLALRCATIGLLAFALARPSIQAFGFFGDQQAPIAAAFVFDTAPHMDYRHQNRTRLQSAQETADWLLAQLPLESEVAVVEGRSQASTFAVDLGAARQRIKRLATSPVGLPLASSADEALRLLGQSPRARKELYIFSDLARSNWSESATQNLKRRLSELRGIGIYVIDAGVKEPRNFSLGPLQLVGQILSKNSPLRVQTEVTRLGPGSTLGIELYLIDARGNPMKRSQQAVDLQSAQAQHVDFKVGGLAIGTHQGFVKLIGEDGLAVDDTRYFTVQVQPPWKVLIAAPQSAERRAAEYGLFLTEALAPYDFRAKGEAAFKCETCPLEQIADKQLGSYVAVCLLDPTPIPPATWERLRNYTRDGGSVGVFLGRNAHPADSFNSPAAQELLPGKLVRQFRAAQREIYLAPDNLQHPILAKFRSLESSVPWNAFPIFRHWQLGDLAKGVGVVMSYSNNLPALLDRPVGHGHVLTMTTPISDPANADPWNILPTGDEPWPFLMLANEMLLYMTGSSESRLNYLAGETAVVRLPAEGHYPLLSLTTPRGDQLRQSVDQKQHTLAVTSTDQLGNYRAQAGGENQGASVGFSINLPTEGSELARISDEQLKAAFGDTPFRLAHNREEIDRSVNIGRVGFELYPFLIAILVLVLSAEQILANRFYHRVEQRPPKASSFSSADAETAPRRAQHASEHPVGMA